MALYRCHGIGRSILRNLLPLFGGKPQALMQASDSELYALEGVSSALVKKLRAAPAHMAAAAAEISFAEKNGIRILTFFDADYPYRLKRCEDAPLFFFCKGEQVLNPEYSLAIVGTRNATEHGRRTCAQLVAGLAAFKPLIISGMALGVDIVAHKTALDCALPTAAVLAHGLDTLYPPQHRTVAGKMLQQRGVLVSEYPSGTRPDKGNFPERNRIIAGLSDAVIVVEAAERGGALITAELASDYHREVFAIPGRPDDVYAAGCNKLIRDHKASLVQNAEDVVQLMGWQQQKAPKAVQRKLMHELSEEEALAAGLMAGKEYWHIDELMANTPFTPARLSAVLLSLEMQGLVCSLPGKRYRII